MKNVLIVFALLGLTTAIAMADDDAAGEEAGDGVKAEQQDCSKLEGDAKVACEEAKAKAEPKEEKGGKSMNKSDDNRMESFDDDNMDEDEG